MTARSCDPGAQSGPGASSAAEAPAHLTVFIDDGSDEGAWADALRFPPFRSIGENAWTNGFVPQVAECGERHRLLCRLHQHQVEQPDFLNLWRESRKQQERTT